MIEISPFTKSPYNNIKGDLYYMPMVGYYKKTNNNTLLDMQDYTTITLNADVCSTLTEQSREFTKKAKANINLSTKRKVSSAKYSLPKDIDMQTVQRQEVVSKDNVYKKEQLNSSSVGENWDLSPDEYGLICADHEVSNSWYFKLNTVEFAHIKKDVCGYIALGLLVCYHEYFSCTGYFSAKEADDYICVADGPFKTEIPAIDDDLIGHLKGSRSNLSDARDIQGAFNDFMKGKNIKYNNWTYYLGCGSLKGQIRANSPTILFGNMALGSDGSKKAHAVVVYGYFDNGKLLVHYGHEYKSQVILCNYITGSYYGIENKSEHKHNSKYFKNGKDKYCGCGKIMVC